MFCKNCGNKIPDTAAFCNKCGTKISLVAQPSKADTSKAASSGAPSGKVTALNMEIIGKTGKNGKLIAMGAAAAVILLVGVITVGIRAGFGKDRIYKVLNQTIESYSKEIEELVSKNPVLEGARSSLSQSYTMRFRFLGTDIGISDDKNSKILSAEAALPGLPTELKIFASDTRLIAGVPNLMYLEADPKAMGSDISRFTNSIPFVNLSYLDYAFDILDEFDLSYTNLTNFKNSKLIPSDINDIIERYIKTLQALIEKSDYSKRKSSVMIGGKNTKTDMLVLAVDYEVMEKWVNEDLFPALRNDEDFMNYMDTLTDLANRLSYDRSAPDYNELLDELETLFEDFIEDMKDSEGIIYIRAQVYKGVIVSVELSAEDKSSEPEMSVKVSALGDKYRLNHIGCYVYEGDSEEPSYSVEASGNHVASDVFDTVITITEDLGNSDKNKYETSIEWDLKEVSNNFKIKAGGNTQRLTLALDDKEVIARYAGMSLSLNKLEGTIDLPEKTTLIRNANATDILDVFSSLINYFL